MCWRGFIEWKSISTDRRTGIRRQASVSTRQGSKIRFTKQAWKVLTIRMVTGARGSARKYENRFRNRHATKHAQDHADVHGYCFKKIGHASSILKFLDAISR